jgi:exopolyphosphatase/guanosine-5'-triphosphate,3'-diphosphate pyrophosphatase
MLRSAALVNLGCIDIGSNTTRLLVAEVEDGRLREVANRRVFTSLGASLTPGGEIPASKVAEVAEATAGLTAEAHALGATKLAVVATAAVRRATNRAALEGAIAEAGGPRLRVLSGTEEAELSFAGACHALPEVQGRLAVVDVGGGSTEVAVGEAHGHPEWSQSLHVGSSLLRERHLRSDPPHAGQVEAACAEVDELLSAYRAPDTELAVAVGGTATSLLGLVGRHLTAEGLRSGLSRLCAHPAEQTAQELGLPLERARLLPAGIAVLAGVAAWLSCALEIVHGGLREGALLEMARA